jgi:hypothetical protein
MEHRNVCIEHCWHPHLRTSLSTGASLPVLQVTTPSSLGHTIANALSVTASFDLPRHTISKSGWKWPSQITSDPSLSPGDLLHRDRGQRTLARWHSHKRDYGCLVNIFIFRFKSGSLFWLRPLPLVRQNMANNRFDSCSLTKKNVYTSFDIPTLSGNQHAARLNSNLQGGNGSGKSEKKWWW